jgi:inosine/xanthosine triphosphate pyrophosphatase family protein
MQRLLFATRNHTKGLLYGPVFERHGFEVVSLEDAGLPPMPELETAQMPLGNALAKARHYHSAEYPWVFGDDGALEVDALGGEPGVQARRWGGRFPHDVDDQTWLDYLLQRLQGVPPERRTAAFMAGWALIAPDGSEHVRIVRYPFRIATEAIRPISPGAPTSAVMVGPESLIEARTRELHEEFERWGIVEQLVARFSR